MVAPDDRHESKVCVRTHWNKPVLLAVIGMLGARVPATFAIGQAQQRP